MISIPTTFSDENENYITMLPLRRFAKERQCQYFQSSMTREKIISGLIDFANISKENEEIILNWIDHTVKEGIKDIYVKKFSTFPRLIDKINNWPATDKAFSKSLLNKYNRHFCGNPYSTNLTMVKYEFDGEQTITFYFCKMIQALAKEKSIVSRWYPVIVEVYVLDGYIIGRAKPKSTMFKYAGVDFDIENAEKTSTENEIYGAIEFVKELLGIETLKRQEACEIFRKKIYNILSKYTETPIEIEDLMQAAEQNIKKIGKVIRKDVCDLEEKYEADIISDLCNMVEKYYSISYPNKTIFTKNRDAYPLLIEATDEEESKIEQTAGLQEPLQSKAIFFDNKKMLQKSNLCDCIKMRYYRKNTLYTSETFDVKIEAKKDYCRLKIGEFVMEEDIKNVLLSIINS